MCGLRTIVFTAYPAIKKETLKWQNSAENHNCLFSSMPYKCQNRKKNHFQVHQGTACLTSFDCQQIAMKKTEVIHYKILHLIAEFCGKCTEM